VSAAPTAPAPEARKQRLLCECASRRELLEGIFRMEFPWAGPPPRSGQFFMLRPERTGVFLARPLSVAGWREAPTGGLILSFLAARRGRGTADLTGMAPGEKAELWGPLGNSWLDCAGFFYEEVPRPLALVSGGVGVAPLSALAEELGDRAFDFYAGFRSGPFGLEGLKARRLIIASEDGQEGHKGRIPDFFSPAGYAAVFACGPLPMLRLIAASCAAPHTPCFVSMERPMACGVGACLGCTVPAIDGPKHCCSDGPVFNAAQLRWQDGG